MDIEELLAREEIKNLRMGYAAHLDSQRYDKLAELFTEDGVCVFGPEFGGDWIGRDTIRAQYETVMKAAGGPFDSVHIITNPWITITGPDTAHGRWYLLDWLTRQKPVTEMETRGGHANPLLYLAVYEDDYRKENGAWKIARTQLHFLWPDRLGEGPLRP